MDKVLILAEKPSSAQKIAASLSQGKAVRKAVHGIAYFEFERQGSQYVVVPAVGHLFSLAEREKSGGYPVFDVEWKPSHEVSETAAFSKPYLQNIAALCKGVKQFVASTDYDLEGEVIAGNLMEFVCKQNPGKVRRMKFSTLTSEELEEAFTKAAPSMDLGLLDAGRTRHRLDFYWGISLSRALMAAMKAGGRFSVMSIGRVQGPALAVLAKRELEISAFKPEPYWEVFALVKDTRFESVRGKLKTEAQAVEAVSKAGKTGFVEKVERKKFHQMPPFPFDLTTLQTEAYKAFSFSPTQTLEVAQHLYEEAVISYPRTSSQKLPERLNLSKIISKLADQPAYSKLAARLVKEKRFSPHEGKNEDPAHPAIFPTGEKPAPAPGPKAKLYDLIVKRFLACFADSAVREKMSVALKLGSEQFVAQGARTIEGNWMEFYSPYAKFEEVTLPDFGQDEGVIADKVWNEKKMTQPPKRYTEASLVRKLEAEDLGTKATRASIIKTLFDRGYVKGKSIEATPLGLTVYNALNDNVPQILSEELTRHFEKEIVAIQSGGKKSAEVIEEGKQSLSKLCEEFRGKEKAIGSKLLAALDQTRREASVLGDCNLCKQGKLIVRKSKYGVFVGCSAYPACRNTFPLPRESVAKPTGKVCEKCGTPIVRIFRKGRKSFSMCLLTTCETKKDWAKPQGALAANTTTPGAPTSTTTTSASTAATSQASASTTAKAVATASQTPAASAPTSKTASATAPSSTTGVHSITAVATAASPAAPIIPAITVKPTALRKPRAVKAAVPSVPTAKEKPKKASRKKALAT